MLLADQVDFQILNIKRLNCALLADNSLPEPRSSEILTLYIYVNQSQNSRPAEITNVLWLVKIVHKEGQNSRRTGFPADCRKYESTLVHMLNVFELSVFWVIEFLYKEIKNL